jgi:hypothetical protein
VGRRFNPPPNWPTPPVDWVPPAGWQPDPAWGPPPSGWQLWLDDEPQGLLGRLFGRRRGVSSDASSPSPTRAPSLPADALAEPALERPAHPAPSVQPVKPEQPQGQPSLKGGPAAGAHAGPAGTPPTIFELWGQRGWGRVEVVGESKYLPEIKRVLGKAHQPSGAEHQLPAHLVPEPHNIHDRNAVAVQISGRTVGYLPRDEAARYTGVLQQLARRGLTAQVQARIWASDYEDVEVDRQGRYKTISRLGAGITLDLAEPHLLVPVNPAPAEAHEMFPIGSAIQVTGEEAHTDTLAQYTGSAGEQWAYATLHELEEQLARSTRTVVEVRLDSQRAGQLSPKMSGDLLPAIRHLNSLGITAACRSIVKGNRAAAQVVLYAKRSHELDDSWFDEVSRRAAHRT